MTWETNLPKEPFPGVSLSLISLVALADLSTIAQRTVLKGGADYIDALSICPGLHRQSAANELNKGEYPACAALTTGYVFRVENPATVNFLQRVGSPGAVTTIRVTKRSLKSSVSSLAGLIAFIPTVMAFGALYILITLPDPWTKTALGILVVARVLNIFVLRRRLYRGSLWKGAREPGVKADLLVLGSQDRWFRIQGLVDDVKAVTSGQWTADCTFFESSTLSIATLLVYASVVLASNASQLGSLVLGTVLLVNTVCLAIANELTKSLCMFALELKKVGEPVAYARRLDLAKELIESTGRRDWAVSMGMIQPEKGDIVKNSIM